MGRGVGRAEMRSHAVACVESEETRKRKRGEAKRRRENKCVCAHKK